METIKRVKAPKQEEKQNSDFLDKMIEYLLTDGKSKRKSVMQQLGAGEEFYTCYLCGELKQKSSFASCTDIRCKSGVQRICRDCAESIAKPFDYSTGRRAEPSRESVMEALEYEDRPFLDSVFQNAVYMAADENSKYDLFGAYNTLISSSQYAGMKYNQSDMFSGGINSMAFMEDEIKEADEEKMTQFEKNKEDTIRLIGYEPFADEAISDQPFLYSQLIGFLDTNEEANEDMMRTASIISIVRSFLQIQKLDNQIARLMQDAANRDKNANAIKTMQESKKSLSAIITVLAAESCISMKNNKNANKGENTWSGKIKRLRDMNLREAENNAFDVGTCEGMRQVADISNASILKQIQLDENDYTEMLANQRKMIKELQEKCDTEAEKKRILLRENLDLKKYCDEMGLNWRGSSSLEQLLDGEE